MKDMKARLSTKMIGESLPLTVVVAVALLSGAMIAVSCKKLWAHPAKRGKHIK